jgi:hypothetical protein
MVCSESPLGKAELAVVEADDPPVPGVFGVSAGEGARAMRGGLKKSESQICTAKSIQARATDRYQDREEPSSPKFLGGFIKRSKASNAEGTVGSSMDTFRCAAAG